MIVERHTPPVMTGATFRHLIFPTNPFKHQKEVFDKIQSHNLILQSPTSSGKTAAVIYPIIDHVKETNTRALFVYPTRALLWDQYQTINAVASSVELRVAKLDPFTPTKDLFSIFAQNRLIAMTPDIFYFTLLRDAQHYKRFFERSIESISHIVFDEIHLYDTYMLFNLRNLLKIIKEINADIKIHCLSATLNHVRKQLEDILDFEIIKGESFTGEIQIQSIFLPSFQMNPEIEELLHMEGRKVVILNSAKRAQEAFDALKRNNSDVFFAVGQRFQEEEPRNRNLLNFNDSESGILVASPIVEQGVDFRAQIVITEDPVNLSSIIQRFGRIGRGGENGTLIVLARADKRHKFYNQDIKLSRSDFELLLENTDGGGYYDPPLEEEKEMMEAMLWKVWEQTQIRDVFEKVNDLSRLRTIYEKYEKYLPDVSFREPSPGVELQTGNIVSIFDCLKRDVWKRLCPNKDQKAVAYLQITSEDFLRSGFIKYSPQVKLYSWEVFRKSPNETLITGLFDIRGVKFKANGSIHQHFSFNSVKVSPVNGVDKGKELYFKPKVFFEDY